MRLQSIFLVTFILIFLIGNASALCELDDARIGPVERNTCVDLWQTCPDCSYVNISQVLYPNTSIAVSNVEMTKAGTNYNYTFCLTSADGDYVYKTYGNSSENGICTQNVNFKVTPNGEEPTTATAFLYIALFAVLIFFLILIFYAHMHDESQLAKFWWFAFMWIPIWAILFVGWNMANDFLTSQGAIQAILYWAWLVIGIAYPFLLLGMVLYTFYWIYQQREVQRLLKRGFSLEDAENKVYRKGGRSYA